MAADMTLLTIAKKRNADDVVGIVEEASRAVPEITGRQIIGGEERQIPNVAYARTIKGLLYKTLIRTALPTAAFRHANEGTPNTASGYEEKIIQTFILNSKAYVDKAIADGSEDGPAALMAMEMAGQLEAALQLAAKCMYYGTNSTYGDAKAYPGFLQSYDATNMVVDAGGSTDSTASSVWMVRWGLKDVSWVMGNDGVLPLSEMTERDRLDASSNPYTSYHQELINNIGLQVTSTNALCRIKKLTADSGKGLTDALLSQAYEKFPAGRPPNAIYMTPRSLGQLQRSRTATSDTGKEADLPTSWQGIPIFPTDMISNVETLAL